MAHSTGSVPATRAPTSAGGEPALGRAVHLGGAGRLRAKGSPWPRRPPSEARGGRAAPDPSASGQEIVDRARGVGVRSATCPRRTIPARCTRRGELVGGPVRSPGSPVSTREVGDPGGAEQPPADLPHPQLTPPGEITGGRAVRFKIQQRRAPAPHREARLASKKVVPAGGPVLLPQMRLEGAEAQLRAEHSVAVLVHEGRCVDHPGSQSWTGCFHSPDWWGTPG